MDDERGIRVYVSYKNLSRGTLPVLVLPNSTVRRKRERERDMDCSGGREKPELTCVSGADT